MPLRWHCAAAATSIVKDEKRLWHGEVSVDRIPILKMGEFLLVTIQVDMHDRLALTLQDDLTAADRQDGVLVVCSSIFPRWRWWIPSSAACLATIAAMARLLDANTVVVGMQPSVAITLVELGLSLKGIRTALDVEKGMALLQTALAEGLEAESGKMLDENPQFGTN